MPARGTAIRGLRSPCRPAGLHFCRHSQLRGLGGEAGYPAVRLVGQVPGAPIAQLAEAADLKSAQSGFESQWGHWKNAGRDVFVSRISAEIPSQCHELSSLKGWGVVKGVLSCFDLHVDTREPPPLS